MPLDSIEFQNSSTNHNFGFSQQDIAKAFDEAASKFMEEILEADCLDFHFLTFILKNVLST
jgi:hypothetical protein